MNRRAAARNIRGTPASPLAASMLLAEQINRRAGAKRAKSRLCPHQPFAKQRHFLAINTTEAAYGGALGGGKTDTLLMDFLSFAHIPGYTGAAIRRISPSLLGPSGLADRAAQWFPEFWHKGDRCLVIPTEDPRRPSRLFFRHCQYEQDKYAFQGLELDWLGVDEAQEFTQSQVEYIKTRVRGTGSQGPIRIRYTANPGQHPWFKERFIDPEYAPGEEQRPFVQAFMQDNPYIDHESYLKRLSGLDQETYAMLVEGKWEVGSQGLIYPIRQENVVDGFGDFVPTHQVIGIDLGASLKQPTTAYVSVLYAEDEPFTTIANAAVLTTAETLDEMSTRIAAMVLSDSVGVTVVVDPGGLGRNTIRELQARQMLAGYAVVEAEKSEKSLFRRLLRDELVHGSAKALAGSADALIEEARVLQWNDTGTDNLRGQQDHATDAWLYAWRHARAYLSEAPAPSETYLERMRRIAEEQKERELMGYGQEEENEIWR